MQLPNPEMKFTINLATTALAFSALFMSGFPAWGAETRLPAYLIEAEDFQFTGSWSKDPSELASNGYYLKTVNGGQPAITAVQIPVAGNYQVWTRSRNYLGASTARRFQLLIDGVPLAKESGGKNYEGWLWENVGAQALSAGEHALILNDTGKYWGRCDAIFMTTDPALLPDKIDLKELGSYRVKPETLDVPVENRVTDTHRPRTLASLKKLASLENGAIRLTFTAGEDESSKPVVVRDTELLVDGQWRKLPAPADEVLFLITSAGSAIQPKLTPQWVNAAGGKIKIASKNYELIDVDNPFTAGKTFALTPVKAVQVDAKTVEVTYAGSAGHQVMTKWSLANQASAVAVAATITAAEAGEYSLGFKLFKSWKPAEVEFNLLPPLYHFQRRPATPQMMTSSITTQPLALVQVKVPDFEKSVAFGVTADPARFSFDWPTPTNARYGFSLLNEMGEVQPVIFTPVLGLPDSKLKAGESKTVSWNILIQPGDWREALQTASNELFKVRDYRQNNGTSLTGAMFNIIDLIKNDEACAWNARLKGFWQIESPDTASQPTPLPLLSAALLTRDEEFYRTRALPSIEFVLTRPKAHFAAEFPKVGGEITAAAVALSRAYIPPAALNITIPSKFFGTSYWQGVDALLGGKNAWVRSMALDDGKIRTSASYSAGLPPWSDMLAAYRMNPTPERLEEIKKACGLFLKKEVFGKKVDDLGQMPFINGAYYPYWWDLLDLYEVTQEKIYLDAAEYCAYFTLAQTAAFPLPPEGDVMVNSAKAFTNPYAMWWRGNVKFRLDWPLKAEDFPERKAPAWVVSRVGLSVEQALTYYNTGDESGMRNILLSAWAPNLLRLYGYTQNPIFQNYARNSTIGRFANYPGYYIHNYTDIIQRADYPIKGPDVTDIYFHHISAELAYVIDYLVTEAWQRSHGEISFPWAKQQGYVWFSNRVYGDMPGKIYGQPEMSLWLDREVAKVGSDQLNYLTARGKDSWSIILMNESEKPVTAPLTIDAKKFGVILDKGYTMVADGNATKVEGNFGNSVTVSTKGITVLTFPAEKAQPVISQSAPALETKPVKLELGGDWGSLNAFRIRSPFGKDSLYVVLTGHPKTGCKVELQVEGDTSKNRALDSFPYEFTVYPWPQDKEAVLKVKLTDGAGKETVSEAIHLAQ